jgi:rhodanese-related sulfurtransferase
MNASTISAQAFIQQYQQGDNTVLDLRTEAEVASECINNCISLPVQVLDEASFAQVLSSQSDKEKPVYLLCQSGKRAEMAVEKLKTCETPQLIIIEGGLNALKSSGINVISGSSHVISLERQVRIAAGALTVLGVVLGTLVNPYYYYLSAFVGAGLMFAGITDSCGMALILAKMPWNKVKK